jgi:hypothetical protein
MRVEVRRLFDGKVSGNDKDWFFKPLPVLWAYN